MDSRVTTFLVAMMNGEKTEDAIKISGVGELTTNEILTEIADAWNKNSLEAMVNFQNWVSTSDKLLNALRDSVRELDDALVNLKSDKK